VTDQREDEVSARRCRIIRRSFLKATRGLEPISYRGALLSTLLHAAEYVYK
jgi:hypothetical protein